MAVFSTPLSLAGGIVLEQLLDRGGKRWSGVYLPRQNDSEYLRHGATGTLCLTILDGLGQGDGVVWCRGGIDGRPNKVNAYIPVLKMVMS
jgi:hypothetical protein